MSRMVQWTIRARRVDASDTAALAAFFTAVQSEEGRVDGLAVSAGILGVRDTGWSQAWTCRQHFDLNVRALLFATRAATAIMPDGGSVVLVGSIAAQIGHKGYGV